LFGKPIQQEVAARAYHEFLKAGVATPEAILRAGWDDLVEVLDRGRYVRFDFSTATKLLAVCEALKKQYGSLSALVAGAGGEGEIARRLQAFKGVGPTTTRIFLRDVRRLWPARRRSRA
jgi:endonuclease III